MDILILDTYCDTENEKCRKMYDGIEHAGVFVNMLRGTL